MFASVYKNDNRYHNPNSYVPLRYLEILFTANTCDSFGATWKHATCPTTYITSGLDDVTYSKLKIIDLYYPWSVDFESSSFLNLRLFCIGVVTSLHSSIPNFFSISPIYLFWEIKIPWFLWHIWRPRKKDSYPSNDISNSFCMSFANF